MPGEVGRRRPRAAGSPTPAPSRRRVVRPPGCGRRENATAAGRTSSSALIADSATSLRTPRACACDTTVGQSSAPSAREFRNTAVAPSSAARRSGHHLDAWRQAGARWIAGDRADRDTGLSQFGDQWAADVSGRPGDDDRHRESLSYNRVMGEATHLHTRTARATRKLRPS